MNIIDLQKQIVDKRKELFPYIWGKSFEDQVPYLLLALSGEVGEACNLGKKYVRSDYDDVFLIHLPEELADVFIYLTLLADVLNIDLEKEVLIKMKHNEARFGNNV